MEEINNNKTPRNLSYYLEIIHNIIYTENRWISVVDIANKLGILWNQNLLTNHPQSTIARIINLYMKKKDVNYKKIQYRDGYDIWVAPINIGIDLLPESAWNLYEYYKKIEYNKRVTDKNLHADAKTRYRLMVNNPFVTDYLKTARNKKNRYVVSPIIQLDSNENKCEFNEPMIYTNEFKVIVSPDCKTCFEQFPQYFQNCIQHCHLLN